LKNEFFQKKEHSRKTEIFSPGGPKEGDTRQTRAGVKIVGEKGGRSLNPPAIRERRASHPNTLPEKGGPTGLGE